MVLHKGMNATNKKVTLNQSEFTIVCNANPNRTTLIISNGEIAGRNAWLFFGNIRDAQAGCGYFLKAQGIPWKMDSDPPYIGSVCGISVASDIDVAILEY
ncbi:MAG: hypothetical protein V3U02_05150 [Calditrichia bacterium]